MKIELERDLSFDVSSVVDCIPDYWYCISGVLHATREMIVEGQVSPGVIYRVVRNQETDNFGSNSKVLVQNCRRRTLITNCSSLGRSLESPLEMLGKKRNPCGIQADYLGYESDIKNEKALLKRFIQDGYRVEEMSALKSCCSNDKIVQKHFSKYPNLENASTALNFYANSSQIVAEFISRHHPDLQENYMIKSLQRLGFRLRSG